MEENNIEQPNSQADMTPEDAKASLGIATYLQGMLMPQEPIEGEETQEMPQGEEQEQEPQIDPEALKEEISGALMKDVKKMIKEEIGGIKDMLKEALKDDEKEPS